MIFGTAGHIDHGKTALVRALTGVDTDRLPDERRRGISIELGFAPIVLDDGAIASIVDVPGHEGLVDTMISGASGIDAALLVVAANEGAMPQTHEHCAVLRALAVPIVAVIVTKIDRVDAASLPASIAHIRGALARNGVSDATPVFPVNATAGVGVEPVRAVLARVAQTLRPRSADDLFRFVVDRAFSVRGTGTVVTGTVWSGGVTVGERVRVLPAGGTWRVRAIQMHGSVVARAVAGSRFALALGDAAPHDIPRGATLVTDDAWSPSTRILVRLDARPERLPRQIAVQLGGRRANARWTASAMDACVLRLALDRPLVARGNDRIVVHAGAGAREMVGATIVDPFPERRAPVVADSPVGQLAALARFADSRGVARTTLPVRLGIVPRELADVIAMANLCQVGERLLDPDVLSAVAARIIALVEQRMTEQPFAQAMSAEQLAALLHVPFPVVEAGLARAQAGGRVARRDGRFVIPGARLPEAAEALMSRVLQWVAAAGIHGATADDAARTFGADADAVLVHAERCGNLIRLGGVRYCEASVVAGAVDRLRAAMSSGREFTPGELRGVFGVSRKYLIPLLEYCDAARVTIRRSGGRVLSDVSSR